MTKGYPETIASLSAFVIRKQVAAFALCQGYANKCESYAKQNARWDDHTSDARNFLTGKARLGRGGIGIYMAHQMYYGVFLELCNSGNFAILDEALRHDEKGLHRELQLMMASLY